MTYDRPGWRPVPAAIGFPLEDSPALCVPTFTREGLKDGEAWCLRGGHVMTLANFMAGKPCPGRGGT
jgi:hypothetical protein